MNLLQTSRVLWIQFMSGSGEEGQSDSTGSSLELTTNQEETAVHVEETHLPTGGHLIWKTPSGTIREVDPDELSRPVQATTDEGDRRCVRCDHARSIATLVREHRACGRVSLDGFFGTISNGIRQCPKCGFEDETGESFPVIARVESCVTCGRAVDVPLGGSLSHR